MPRGPPPAHELPTSPSPFAISCKAGAWHRARHFGCGMWVIHPAHRDAWLAAGVAVKGNPIRFRFLFEAASPAPRRGRGIIRLAGVLGLHRRRGWLPRSGSTTLGIGSHLQLLAVLAPIASHELLPCCLQHRSLPAPV